MGNELIVGTGALAPNRSLSVLVAEDSRADAELLLAALKHAGVALANFDVVDAPESFRRRLDGTRYDIVLTDHSLITWTGMDALEILQHSGKDIPLIVVTGSLGDEQAVQYIKKGAADYVLKEHLGHLATAIDRTLREEAIQKHATQLQAQIARGKREWELTFDAVPDPTFVIGEDCRIVRANRAASNVFGLTFDGIIGKCCYEVIHDRQTPLPACPHQDLLQSGGDAEGDIEEVRLGKTFHSTTSVLRDPDGAFRGCVHVLHDVTAQRVAEDALRRQALTFENMYDAVVVCDKDYRITDWNPAATAWLGYEAAEVLGRDVSLLHPPELAEKQLRSIRTGVETAGRWSGELAIVGKGGARGISETIIVPLRNQDGVPVGLIGVSRDISDRKRAEVALRDSEAKYRLLFEGNPQPMWVYDVSSLRFLAVNQAAVDHYGYSRDEFLSMTLKDIRPPEDVPALLSSVLSVNGDIDKAGVWKHRTKDGRNIYVEITDCRIDFDGRPASLVLSNDVTEQRRAERELHESEEKYRELIENAIYGIFRATPDGTLLDVNPAFVEMLGYDSKEELLQVNLAAGVYEDPAERTRVLRGYQSVHRRMRAETNFKHKDGRSIKVRLDGREVRAADNQATNYFEVFVEDVTQQRDLEEQFRQAQKMEAVGRLAGGIAHDFNNVLMVINSYAEMIANIPSPDARVQRYAERLIDGAKKATSLTSKLLAFSRKQLLQPVVLDLHSVTTDLTAMLAPMLGEDIKTTIVTEPELGNVYADRAQIEQVLMNLAINARDAMPNGGKLLIELNNVDVDQEYTQRHPQVLPGAYVVLIVSDDGIGMDAATQARIFEPFFTTKGVGKGTGLGLSTVYGIVKQSGGFVWVYSEPGLGTTFKIYLPRVFREADSVSDLPEETQNYAGNNETILLVDDEADLRSAAREFLEEKGYRVLEAENGAGALAVCTAHRGSIEALVTDLIMPGMRGPVLAAKIATLYPRIKTVFMSGYTDRSQDIEDLGPDAVFLSKPFSLNTLAQKLQSVLHQKSRAGSE